MHMGCYTKQPLRRLQGGVYHGRIILPPEYPFKPPSFIMISPSGRFETGVKICLSMSSHHPEHWQPSWSVRVALVALIAFLPTSGHGAIGSLVRIHFVVDSTTCFCICSSCTHAVQACELMYHRMAVGVSWLVTLCVSQHTICGAALQDFSKEEKQNLAVESRKAPPKYGSEAKQQIINNLHARMLAAQQASALGIS